MSAEHKVIEGKVFAFLLLAVTAIMHSPGFERLNGFCSTVAENSIPMGQKLFNFAHYFKNNSSRESYSTGQTEKRRVASIEHFRSRFLDRPRFPILFDIRYQLRQLGSFALAHSQELDTHTPPVLDGLNHAAEPERQPCPRNSTSTRV